MRSGEKLPATRAEATSGPRAVPSRRSPGRTAAAWLRVKGTENLPVVRMIGPSARGTGPPTRFPRIPYAPYVPRGSGAPHSGGPVSGVRTSVSGRREAKG
ncbi:hypothetical protein GCM10010282_07670 [Streptomyces roseolus]|nr:hypothetical protein GCM10010282_07670 [Streptomyces roseolus]